MRIGFNVSLNQSGVWRNALPSTLFGILLLALAVGVILLFPSQLPQTRDYSFDPVCLLLLVFGLVFTVFSILFFRRTRCVKILTSVVIHIFAVVLMLAFLLSWHNESSAEKIGDLGLATLDTGVLSVAVLVLHGESVQPVIQ